MGIGTKALGSSADLPLEGGASTLYAPKVSSEGFLSKRMRKRVFAVALCVAGAASVLACSLVLGLKDGDLVPGTDASDAGVPIDDRPILTPDASTATCAGGLDGSFTRDIVADSDAVYVLQGGSTIVSACGSKVNPCGSITVGITVANANRAKAIYVGPGTYAETIALPSGVSIEGGFDVAQSTWAPLCENVTTIIAPPSAIVVEADGVLNAALRFVTIETKAHGDVGESLFAVRAMHSALTLENVNLYAEIAGPGKDGPPGSGTDNSDPSCGASGANGPSGSAGASGGFDGQGNYAVGAGGGTGVSGSRGASGTVTAPACSTSCIDTCSMYTYPTDDAGNPIDDAGNELDATTACFSTTKNVCGIGASAACGGQGGLGGGGGANGAASVAVFAIGADTAITITGGALVSAGGGLGGAGGVGANGGSGSGASTAPSATCSGPCDPSCTPTNGSVAGGSTTAGQNGGVGGSGGGGAGGPTFLVVTIGGAQVTIAQTAQWKIPTAGAGGGAPNGPAGAFGAGADF